MAPISSPHIRVRTPYKQRSIEVTASTPEYQIARGITMKEGEFYSLSDVERARKVAVLGPSAELSLFPQGGAIGRDVMISSVPYRVIGVTNPRGAGGGLGADLDDQLYVPLMSLLNLTDSDGIDLILVKAKDRPSHYESQNQSAGRSIAFDDRRFGSDSED